MVAQQFKPWRRQPASAVVKENLIIGAIILLVVATLPLVALVLLATRAVLGLGVVAVLVCGLAAYAVSPAFRAWLKAFTDSLIQYRGLRLATDVRFHPSHSWARMEEEVSVGVDDLVQAALGPVDEIELPPSGLHVAQGERLFRLRHGDRVVEVRSPVSGTVLGVNAALHGHPELINDQPFAHGWAVRLHGDDPWRERQSLLRGKEARIWFQSAADRIVGLLPEKTSTVREQGVQVGQWHRHIDDVAWRQLTETMFS